MKAPRMDGWLAGWPALGCTTGEQQGERTLIASCNWTRALLAAANEQWPPGSGLSVMSVKVAGRYLAYLWALDLGT